MADLNGRDDLPVQKVLRCMTRRWGSAMPDASKSLRLFPPRSHVALYGVCWGGPDQPAEMQVSSPACHHELGAAA